MKLGKLILRSDGDMEVENIEVQPEELEGLQKILVLVEKTARAARMSPTPIAVGPPEEKCQVIGCLEPIAEPICITAAAIATTPGAVRIYACKTHAEELRNSRIS